MQHILTTAYNSQANGMVENVHRQIKDALLALPAGRNRPQQAQRGTPI
jgi:hypothetical protein